MLSAAQNENHMMTMVTLQKSQQYNIMTKFPTVANVIVLNRKISE